MMFKLPFQSLPTPHIETPLTKETPAQMTPPIPLPVNWHPEIPTQKGEVNSPMTATPEEEKIMLDNTGGLVIIVS